MKRTYVSVSCEIQAIDREDVIRTSGLSLQESGLGLSRFWNEGEDA